MPRRPSFGSSVDTKFVLHENRVMKNVTVTMEEHVAEWARLEAARRNTSVSRLIGEMLAEKMHHADAYDRAMRDWMDRAPTFTSGGPYPTRDEIYAERLDRFR